MDHSVQLGRVASRAQLPYLLPAACWGRDSAYGNKEILCFYCFQQRYPMFPERQSKPIKALSSHDREADEVMEPIWQHRNFRVENYVLNFHTSWQYIKSNLVLHNGPKTELWGKKEIFLFSTSHNWDLIHTRVTLLEVISKASSCSVCMAMLPTLLPQLKQTADTAHFQMCSPIAKLCS